MDLRNYDNSNVCKISAEVLGECLPPRTSKTALTYIVLGFCISQSLILAFVGMSLRKNAEESYLWITALGVALAAYFTIPILHENQLEIPAIAGLAIVGAIPSIFLLLCQGIFQDEPIYPKPIKTIAAVFCVINIILAPTSYSLILAQDGIINSIYRGCMAFPIILSFWLTLSGFRDDLVRQRLYLRCFFMFFVGILIIFDAVFNDFNRNTWSLGSPGMLATGVFAAIELFLINVISVLGYVRKFLFPMPANLDAEVKIETITPESPYKILKAKLDRLMNEDKLYLEDSLSLSLLAHKVQEPTYKLRGYINQELGFRNFNSYLNSFRIKKAQRLFKDPENYGEKVFAIAIRSGFSSISPFNRAFKSETGFTPSEFKKDLEEKEFGVSSESEQFTESS